MANHDWVDSRIAGLAADREWFPDGARVLSKLRVRRREKVARVRRWMWTSVAATAVYMTLFLFPASRACAKEPGPCVLRAFGVTSVAVEIDPAFRAEFERDLLPSIIDRKVKWTYRTQPGHALVVICDGKREVVAGLEGVRKGLEECL